MGVVNAVRMWVVEWMKAQGLDQEPVWKWHPENETIDMGAAIQGFGLSGEQIQALEAGLGTQFSEIERVAVHPSGFLNVRFTGIAWAQFVHEWANDTALWFSVLRLPDFTVVEAPSLLPRLGRTFHDARILVQMPGWQPADFLPYEPTGAELRIVKQLLALEGTAQPQVERPRKRIRRGNAGATLRHASVIFMQQTSALILQLWQQPILLPSDLPGSAFRRNVLKLILESTPVAGESVEYPVEYSPSPEAP